MDKSGLNLVTSGLDGKLSVWDIRTYKRLHSYHTPRPVTCSDISQTGLLSIACGHEVYVWKDAIRTKAKAPYMKHAVPGKEVKCVKFRPYEDVMCLSYSEGLETVIIPGAGTANFDAFEANPFQDSKQRREHEVHAVLEKIQPDMITLDPNDIGKVDRALPVVIARERRDAAEERAKKEEEKKKEKKKARGKSRIGRKLKRKNKNIVTAEREAMKKSLEEQEKELPEVEEETKEDTDALSRFIK